MCGAKIPAGGFSYIYVSPHNTQPRSTQDRPRAELETRDVMLLAIPSYGHCCVYSYNAIWGALLFILLTSLLRSVPSVLVLQEFIILLFK